MCPNFGKAIELFLVNGTADSIVTAELSNWNGKAIKIPRIEIKDCNRDDITKAGVYFLICRDEDGANSVYIGEAENIKARLICHINDYNAGRENYYWYEVVMFTGNDLNKASIRYLENELFSLSKKAGRYKILTGNTFKNTVLKESDKSTLQEFIYNIKILLNALSYKILEPIIVIPKSTANYFYTKGRGANAKAIMTGEGFVVLKGSVAAKDVTNSFIKEKYNLLREKLIEDKVIKNYKFTRDYIFNSPSAASSVLIGNSTNGRICWKNEDGKSLKELQIAQDIMNSEIDEICAT